MIDVRFVIAHSLWILGAAVGLAAFSYYYWWAGIQRVPLRQTLRHARGWQLSVGGAAFLIACGLIAMDATPWWVRGAGLLIGVGAALHDWRHVTPPP